MITTNNSYGGDMKRTTLAILTLVAAALATGPAGAHDDPRDDGFNDSPHKCDTYYRPGHAPQKKPNGTTIPENQRRSDHHTNEFDQGQVGPVYIHNHTGHYVVRHDDFYIEVVGGGGYNRDGNQGGWAQGEVDRSEVPFDVDFHANAFAGTEGDMHSEAACLSVADNRVGDPGTRPSARIRDGHTDHIHLLLAPNEAPVTLWFDAPSSPDGDAATSRAARTPVNAVALLA
jgi:hypothetical protein